MIYLNLNLQKYMSSSVIVIFSISVFRISVSLRSLLKYARGWQPGCCMYSPARAMREDSLVFEGNIIY